LAADGFDEDAGDFFGPIAGKLFDDFAQAGIGE